MKLQTIIRGEKANPPVILIHGLLGAARNLMRLQEKITALGYYTIAYDQRGHGHSPHGPLVEYRIDVLAKDLISLMSEHDIEKAHLVGHSLGGRVSMVTSALFPDRVLSLSMLDVSPKINQAARDGLAGVLNPLPDYFTSKDEAKNFLENSIPLKGKAKNLFEQFLMSNLRDRNGRMEWIFDLKGVRKGLFPSLQEDQYVNWKKITCPILIVRGGASEHFGEDEVKLMLSTNKHARTATVPNAGHWVHADNLDGTFEAIKDFLMEFKK